MSIVDISGLSVKIGQKTLLRDISVHAEAGQVTGLIGPNGAGKSTLLAAMCGDLEATAGSISLAGVDPAQASPKELALIRAVMLQDVSVSFEFLVRDVVAMGRRPWAKRVEPHEDEQVIDAALAATDTTHLAGRDIATLSGGERARVALARVLAQQTPIVFLDEPTAALDISHQEQVLALVKNLAREANIAVFVVMHDLNAAAAYCDRIICLADGTIAAMGEVSEVYTDEILSSVYQWPIEVTSHNGHFLVSPARQHPTPEQDDLVQLLGAR